jgi:hypothetical protein
MYQTKTAAFAILFGPDLFQWHPAKMAICWQDLRKHIFFKVLKVFQDIFKTLSFAQHIEIQDFCQVLKINPESFVTRRFKS